MRTTFRSIAATMICAAAAVAAAQYAPTPSAPAHLQAGESMARGIYNQGRQGMVLDALSKPYNNYGASWGSTVFEFGTFGPNSTGQIVQLTPFTNNTVCANFVTHSLMTAYPLWDWSAYTLANGGTTVSPDPAQMAYFINNNKGLTKVTDPTSIKAGDIIAIDYASYPNGAGNVGHAMIVRSKLGVTTTKAPKANPDHVYYLHKFGIVDSTATPHDKVIDGLDSRNYTTLTGTTVQSKGAGVGVFYIVTDKDNSIKGYLWDNVAPTMSASIDTIFADKHQSQAKRPMTIGRYVPVAP